MNKERYISYENSVYFYSVLSSSLRLTSTRVTVSVKKNSTLKHPSRFFEVIELNLNDFIEFCKTGKVNNNSKWNSISKLLCKEMDHSTRQGLKLFHITINNKMINSPDISMNVLNLSPKDKKDMFSYIISNF